MNHIFICNAGPILPDRFHRFHAKSIGAVVHGHDFTALNNAGKWKNLHRMILQSGPYSEMDYFWFPDPDIMFAPDMPEQLFADMPCYGLDLAQPSLTANSVCSHPHLFKNAEFQVMPRQVPFVEIMCPCFSYAALKRNLWTFDLNYSGFGIDLLWGTKEKCFVLDWLTVTHPSSPGYHNTAKAAGFPDPNRELAEIKRLYL